MVGVGSPVRQPLSNFNAGPTPAPVADLNPGLVASAIDFNLREDVEILLNEKKKGKNKNDYKVTIPNGNSVQVIDPDHKDCCDFDLLDDTKTWPEDLLPLQPVGRLVLNKNVNNFFAENEQLAFGSGLVVPGVYYLYDKMLQCRVFAYADTQREEMAKMSEGLVSNVGHDKPASSKESSADS